MASPRLLVFAERARKIPVWAGKGYVPSRETPKLDGLNFQRAQSKTMQEQMWEDRIKPQRSWLQLIALFIGFAVFMAACVFLATI